MLDLAELTALSEEQLRARAISDPTWFREITAQFAASVEDDRKAVQIAYYTPANPMARPVHLSTAREIAIVGGNRSSKTDTALAELVIQLTGHIPLSLMADYPREKIKATGIRARVVCNSLTDTLEPVIKPKLRWDQWNGDGDPSEGRGHWGWIPRHCLVGGTWEKSYSEKYRTLTVANDAYWHGANGEINSIRSFSTCQFLSYDQDLTAFAGASLNLIIHDELPPSDIYREDQLRTLDVKGRIITAFTPPDEGGVSRSDVSWFYDTVYQRGLPGPNKHPQIDTFQLFTERNRILAPDAVQAMIGRLTEDQRRVRLHGEFIHMSGVIYKEFVQSSAHWCFKCQKLIVPMDGLCLTCGSDQVDHFTHVIDPHPIPATWPIIFVIDPHPRKKDAMGWFAITPADEIVMVAEHETEGTADDVARSVRSMEDALGIRPVRRLMDPNIAVETNDKLHRGWTLRQAYDAAGLRCDLANDAIGIGINQVHELLRPDLRTHRPLFRCFSTCERFIHGMTHWSFDDWTRQGDREPKEKVRDVAKDFPDLLRYLALDKPSYTKYTIGPALHDWGHGRSPRGY